MPQSLAQVYLHVIFSTKNRAKYLQDRALREELHRYLGGTCQQLDSPSLIVGGVEDHVHILCRLSRTLSIADLVRELKRESSKWIKTKDEALWDFHWQDGYGAFSISPSHVEELRTTSPTRKCIIGKRASRMSSDASSRSMASSMTNGTYGIE